VSAVLDISTTPQVPFARLVRVELRKTYDTRAGFWLLTLVALLVLAVESIALLATAANDEAISLDEFVAVAALITSLMLPILGILLVTSEWSQRTGMVTFALEPRRQRVLLAKLATGALLTLATLAFALVLGTAFNALSLGIRGEGSWHLGWGDVIGFVLVQTLTMTGGFALAALLLNTPAALVVFFLYKWALPGVLFALGSRFESFGDVAPFINLQEALLPLGELSLDRASEWAHLLVAGTLWLVLPLAAGTWRILRAEVK
jgi:ABC-2 type transport system permease protein